jgi:MoaA/NifB/PqqE/SkfB family radical SAM enzyme
MGYCVYPSNYPYIGHTGTLSLCCNNQFHTLPYNIKTHSLKDIWHSKEINKVRDTLANKLCPSGCEFCFDKEAEGVRSFRQKALRGTFGTNEPFNDTIIRGLDLRLGNMCNLACIMCNSYSSVQLYRQLPEMAKHYGWLDEQVERQQKEHNPKLMDWADHDSSWENILSGIDENLQHVYMAGGEPFYVNNFEDVLHNMMGYAPHARYVINTNGTRLLKDKDIKRFKQYNLSLRVSIDGLGDVDEYIRQGTIWEEKIEVIKQYHKYFKIDCWDLTLNSLSIRQAPKLIEWLTETFPNVKINVRPAYGNGPMHLWRIPESLRKDVLLWFKLNKKLAWGSDGIITELEKPYQTYKPKLRQVISYWDQRGRVKLNSIDPVLNKYIHED